MLGSAHSRRPGRLHLDRPGGLRDGHWPDRRKIRALLPKASLPKRDTTVGTASTSPPRCTAVRTLLRPKPKPKVWEGEPTRAAKPLFGWRESLSAPGTSTRRRQPVDRRAATHPASSSSRGHRRTLAMTTGRPSAFMGQHVAEACSRTPGRRLAPSNPHRAYRVFPRARCHVGVLFGALWASRANTRRCETRG